MLKTVTSKSLFLYEISFNEINLMYIHKLYKLLRIKITIQSMCKCCDSFYILVYIIGIRVKHFYRFLSIG